MKAAFRRLMPWVEADADVTTLLLLRSALMCEDIRICRFRVCRYLVELPGEFIERHFEFAGHFLLLTWLADGIVAYNEPSRDFCSKPASFD